MLDARINNVSLRTRVVQRALKPCHCEPGLCKGHERRSNLFMLILMQSGHCPKEIASPHSLPTALVRNDKRSDGSISKEIINVFNFPYGINELPSVGCLRCTVSPRPWLAIC